MAEPRPLILVPARFSATASALRYRAEVGARALLEAVYEAGGEPLLMHPHAPGGRADVSAVASRLSVAHGVLLPRGGDLHPSWAGQRSHPSEYDVDVEQDAFDLAVAARALRTGLPLLAICRGTQVVNVMLGGDVVQDMASAGGEHRHRTHRIAVAPGTLLASIAGDTLAVSCYHHQCLGRLGDGLTVVAEADDGVPEAVESPAAHGWFLGVQWHPEDTAADSGQAALFAAFVAAARDRVAVQSAPADRSASERPPSQVTPTCR
jgi:putative glutamine amidotransferase